MNPKVVNILGMWLNEWRIDSCIAHFGVGKDWATLFYIESSIEGRGHASTLLAEAKNYYESKNKKVGGSVALNPKMKHLYKKLKIKEYK